MRMTTQSAEAPYSVSPAVSSWPSAKAKVPPELASLMPPVSGLLQPTLIRLALEKLVPANGPAEKISGFSGDSGSTVAAPLLSRVLAMKCRPTRMMASPCNSSDLTERSRRLMCRYLRISTLPCGDRKPGKAGAGTNHDLSEHAGSSPWAHRRRPPAKAARLGAAGRIDYKPLIY